MLRLLESRRTTRHPQVAAILSLAAHTLAIGTVVVGTATGEPNPEPARVEPPLVYLPVDPAPRPPAPAGPARPVAEGPPAPVIVPPIDIPTEIPPIGDPAPTIELIRDGLRPSGDGGPSARVTGPGIGPDTSVFIGDLVERPVRALGQVRRPRYPDLLRRNQVSGSVLASFVVDTLGRAEPVSFRAESSTHTLFTEAVRGAVLSMRFAPAEVEGRRVRQLVQQRFVFELAR
jgi:protein TonB